MAKLNWAEARRYLGLKVTVPELEEKLGQAGEWLLAAAAPKAVWQQFPILWEDRCLSIAGMQVDSRDLHAHLEGCSSCFLFTATLGVEVDRLLTRLSVTDASAAVMVQACAAAYLEDFCDEQCQKIAAASKGFLRPRFSPGYGDFSVEHNFQILAALNAGKTIGLSTTTASMLVPTKSVTAVIGLSERSDDRLSGCGSALGCSACSKKDCAFRREG